MWKLLIWLAVSGIVTVAQAQEYKNYQWEENPGFILPQTMQEDENLVGLMHEVVIEYYNFNFDSTNPRKFVTRHDMVYVKNEEGVKKINRIYIPMADAKKLIEFKARTIASDGIVQLMDQSNIKAINNVEEYGDFKIYALEGLSQNMNVEVIYTVEKTPSPFGYEVVQQDYRLEEANVMLVSQSKDLKTRVYPDDKTPKLFFENDKDIASFSWSNMPGMKDEPFAAPKANKIGLAYQCFVKSYRSNNRIILNKVTSNICREMFPNIESPRAWKEIRNGLGDIKKASFMERASWVDHHIKSNYTISGGDNEAMHTAKYTLKNHTGSARGIMAVYGHFLKAVGVGYQIVLTASNDAHHVDPYFFTPRSLQQYLIYVYAIDQYITPLRPEYRLGEPPNNLLGNQGIFVKLGFPYKTKEIKPLNPDYSSASREVVIDFENNMNQVTISQEHHYYGYWATQHRGGDEIFQ